MSPPRPASTSHATTPPFQEPPLETDLPGFVTPPAAATSPPADPPSPSPEAPSENDWLEPESSDASAAPSKGSRKRSPVSTDPAAFAGVFRQLFSLFAYLLHLRLAPRHVPNDVWLADEQDLDAIATPLSRIAARHSPIDGPGGDVGDAIEVLVGIGGYGIKNTMKRAELDQPPGWEQQDEQQQASPPVESTPPAPAYMPFSPQ